MSSEKSSFYINLGILDFVTEILRVDSIQAECIYSHTCHGCFLTWDFEKTTKNMPEIIGCMFYIKSGTSLVAVHRQLCEAFMTLSTHSKCLLLSCPCEAQCLWVISRDPGLLSLFLLISHEKTCCWILLEGLCVPARGELSQT